MRNDTFDGVSAAKICQNGGRDCSRANKGLDVMRAGKRWTAASILGLALASVGLAATVAATRPHPARAAHAKPTDAHRATLHAGAKRSLRRPTFRPASRMAAAREAAQLGTTVGNGCKGKADMQRDEHQWVVLCSNGKTYLVGMPATAPAVQCSLAGIGPEPACFSE